jgi:RNA polymerase sigma-70 factor, ECF subfamily
MSETYHQHEAALRRFLTRLTGDPFLAEDLSQETMLRAHRAERRGDSSAFTWLCAIGLNLVRDHARVVARRPEDAVPDEDLAQYADTQDIEADALENEMAACIRSFVLALPERQRTMVALHDLGGCDQAEVAALLGVEPGHARVILHRGRAALRRRMERDCDLAFGDAIACSRRAPPPAG